MQFAPHRCNGAQDEVAPLTIHRTDDRMRLVDQLRELKAVRTRKAEILIVNASYTFAPLVSGQTKDLSLYQPTIRINPKCQSAQLRFPRMMRLTLGNRPRS